MVEVIYGLTVNSTSAFASEDVPRHVVSRFWKLMLLCSLGSQCRHVMHALYGLDSQMQMPDV